MVSFDNKILGSTDNMQSVLDKDKELKDQSFLSGVIINLSPDIHKNKNDINTNVHDIYNNINNKKNNYSGIISNLNGGFLNQLQDNYDKINKDKEIYHNKQEELKELKINNYTLEYRLKEFRKNPVYMFFLCWSIIFIVLLVISFFYLIGEEQLISGPIQLILTILFIFVTSVIIKNIIGYYNK